MKSLWNPSDAARCAADPLALRVYSSRLLGQAPSLVLHGGGNTSVKALAHDLFGDAEEVLYVKGSGWDLASIEAAGFAPVRLGVLQRMAGLERLSDAEMVRAQRAAMTDPAAPNPSVEAILHAIIPFKFVDHTHADAVVTVTNTPSGEQRIREIYGDRVLIIPYVMPGFILARKIFELTQGIDWSRFEGMILLNHGLFSFADDPRESYERMIRLVSEAEGYLQRQGVWPASCVKEGPSPSARDAISSRDGISGEEPELHLARIRRAVSQVLGTAVVCQWARDDLSLAFSARPDVAEIAIRGPLTPDHVIRTKPIPVILREDAEASIQGYAAAYRDYFARNDDGRLKCLNPAPCWGVWPGRGVVSFDSSRKGAAIVADIVAHTLPAICAAEGLGGWRALPERDLFEMEYWELEQAKLGKGKAPLPLQGRIALVTGAASGIGKACVEELLAQGAVVTALDLNPAIATLFGKPEVLGLVCDVTDAGQLCQAVAETVRRFGGLDILVSNAGAFFAAETIAEMSHTTWQTSLAVNLTSHQQLLQAAAPYLQLGIQPAVVMIASKNVPAPGPGAAAYSVAKAGQTQLARVAALEMAKYGVRVNVLHPDAVFDTGIWSDEMLATRAAHYGISVEQYKRKNLLRSEIRSKDVAALAAALAGPLFAHTTGAQVPIDGGNERVI